MTKDTKQIISESLEQLKKQDPKQTIQAITVLGLIVLFVTCSMLPDTDTKKAEEKVTSQVNFEKKPPIESASFAIIQDNENENKKFFNGSFNWNRNRSIKKIYIKADLLDKDGKFVESCEYSTHGNYIEPNAQNIPASGCHFYKDKVDSFNMVKTDIEELETVQLPIQKVQVTENYYDRFNTLKYVNKRLTLAVEGVVLKVKNNTNDKLYNIEADVVLFKDGKELKKIKTTNMTEYRCKVLPGFCPNYVEIEEKANKTVYAFAQNSTIDLIAGYDEYDSRQVPEKMRITTKPFEYKIIKVTATTPSGKKIEILND